MNFEITYNDVPVGTAAIEKTGLYWKIQCLCNIKSEAFFMVYATGREKSLCLGMLAPEKGKLALRRSIACKQLPLDIIRFHVAPKRPKEKIHFAPIYPEEPFSYLQRLKNSRLEVRQNIKGIALDPDPPGNGQSQGYPDE